VFRVIAHQIATAPQQMCDAGLMDGAVEAAIGDPAVADQHAVEIGAEQSRGFLEAAAALNRVDRGIRCDGGPQPVRMPANFPAGFIGADHRTAADGVTQAGVGRPGLSGRAMQRVHQPAGGDVQTEAVVEQGADFAQRQTELFIEDRGDRDRLGPELRRRGAERVRCLQSMAALHPPVARGAVADRDRERPHDRLNARQVLLILHRVAGQADGPAAMRAGGGQRRLVGLVDARGNRAMRPTPIREASPPTGPPRPTPGQAARERRGLTMGGPSRRIQFVFEPLDLLAQRVPFATVPIARMSGSVLVATEAFDFALLPRDLLLLPLELGDQFLARRRAPPRSHAAVIASCGAKYKRKLTSSRPLSAARASRPAK
jgi:hypothetical protein